MSAVYYNEFDPKAAAWIRELIEEGVIPDGIVDERSITDVRADELRGFTQCHFFAGVGGWPFALRLAGIPDDFPCWTGSCPCQPFSNAGKQKGTEDERDLWPIFAKLITECKPQYVFGEQVASAIKFGWIDRVHADLEREGYACGEVVLGAHSVGAPHIRQRLYWGASRMADSSSNRCVRSREDGALKEGLQSRSEQSGKLQNGLERCSSIGRLAQDSAGLGRGGWSNADSAGNDRQIQAPGLVHDERLSNSNSERCNGQSVPDERRQKVFETAGSDSSNLPPWSDFGLVLCRDTDKQGRHRVRRVPAESVLLGVADGFSEDLDTMRYQSILEHPERAFPLCAKDAVPGRAMLLKGYGNAIVPWLAAAFITEFLTEVNR